MIIGNSGLINTDFLIEVRKGNVPGHTVIRSFYKTEVIGTTDNTMWNVANTDVIKRDTAVIMTLSSTNGGDTLAGTGCQKVEVTGLLFDYSEDSEIVDLDGQNGVALTKQFLAINALTGIQAGSNKGNIGTIYIGSGTVTAGVPAVIDNLISINQINNIGDMVSQVGFITVKAGFTLYFISITPSTEANKFVELLFYIYTDTGIIVSGGRFDITQTAVALEFKVPAKISEKSLIEVRARVDTGANIAANIIAEMVIIDNNYIKNI